MLDWIAERIVNLLTLGLYSSIVGIIDPAKPNEVLSIVVAGARIAISFFVLFLLMKKVCDRIGLADWIPPVLALIATALIAYLFHPWLAAEKSVRLMMGFVKTLSDESSVRVHTPFSPIASLHVSPPFSGWAGDLFTVFACAAAFYVLKAVDGKLALVSSAALASVLTGAKPLLAITILAAGLLASYALRKFGIASLLPIGISLSAAVSALQLPKWLALLLLTASMITVLISIFYIAGKAVSVVGSVKEKRAKWGMKVKPKKVLEEEAGEWDAAAVAIVLTFLFLASVTLFGATAVGLGTFAAMLVTAFRS